MGWKDWPYWLKGGIIGTVLATLIILIVGFIALSICYENCPPFIKNSLFIFILPSYFLPGVIADVAIIIWNFLIGALIGFIYGKIKSRK